MKLPTDPIMIINLIICLIQAAVGVWILVKYRCGWRLMLFGTIATNLLVAAHILAHETTAESIVFSGLDLFAILATNLSLLTGFYFAGIRPTRKGDPCNGTQEQSP